jgi:Xaa-Pro aminopeptidase
MFSADFFAGNRQHLLAGLKSHSFVALTAHGQMQRSDDTAYPFEQEANFWYLTGIDEAGWLLLIDVDAGREYLVAPQRTEVQRVFDGSLGTEAATRTSGVTEVLARKEGFMLLKNLVAGKQRAYILKPRPRRYHGFYTNRAQHDLLERLHGVATEDVRPKLAKLRAIKQVPELAAMQKAIDITAASLQALAAQLPAFKYEYEAEAWLGYEFRRRGAPGHAFEPIIATGENACTLHYIANDSPLKSGQLVVMDVGARFNHYSADITRTLAIGQPSARQLAIIAAVQRVHDEAIKLCYPGRPVKEYIQAVEVLMGAEQAKLGLIADATDRRSIYTYMPHAISHGLGIEVHDSLGQPEVFAAGMVLTVEPGIYIPTEGIGVRIEDDILITSDGPKILSASLPPRLGMETG